MAKHLVDTQDYRVQILSFSDFTEAALIEQYFANPSVEKIDTIASQIREYLKIKHVGEVMTEEKISTYTTNLLGDVPLAKYGIWAYYSWSNKLVHLLPEDAFIAVRTNRNKLKITEAEQHILSSKKVGIIGLSVGQSVALTMAMERICGELRIADFDTLDLSNLNRLRAGVHQLGMPKVIIAAREIAELDPFLKVTIFPEGITNENLDAFLGTDDSKLDVLIEVCDGLDIKINARKAARSKMIPVVMDTNDRGMIDIERFDLEPNRLIFHGLLDENIDLTKLNTNERISVLMQLASFEQTSSRLKMSMGEIGKTITTWPQLASSVTLGGGATCDVARRILLNQLSISGRFYIDLETILHD